MNAADPDLEPAQQLEALRWHWGGAYVIGTGGGWWRATRADGSGIELVAPTPEGLRDLIIADYTARPVSRDLS